MSCCGRQLCAWLWFSSLSRRQQTPPATNATKLFPVASKHTTHWLFILALVALQGCNSISSGLGESSQLGHASRSYTPEKEVSSRLELSLFDQANYSDELATCYYQSNGDENGVPTGISVKAPRCPAHIIYDFSNNAWIDASSHRQPENHP